MMMMMKKVWFDIGEKEKIAQEVVAIRRREGMKIEGGVGGYLS